MVYHAAHPARTGFGSDEMSGDSDRYGRAGDYVMGRMGPAERERAERDLERDPRFREAVLRLSGRIRHGDTVAAAELWQAVEAGLNSLPQMRAAAAKHPVRAGPARRKAARAAAASHPLAGWKGALLMAGVAAACGASYIAGAQNARPGRPGMLVPLTDASGATGGILEVGEGAMLRFVPLATGGAARGEALQLWTIQDEPAGFVALGTLPAQTTRWRGPDLPRPRPGQRYRVTVGDGKTADGPALLEGTALPVAGR
jgi:anti-sigma-K factor RskA